MPCLKRSSTKAKTTSVRARPRFGWLRRPAILATLVLATLAGAAGATAWALPAVRQELAAMPAHLVTAGIALTAEAGFRLDSVTVSGQHRTDPDRLREALGVARGLPTLGLDLRALRAEIEAIPWVAAARVERRLPDRLHIALTEHRPIAIWEHDGAAALIEASGSVLQIGGLDPHRALPRVRGADAPAHAAQLLRDLAAAPELAAQIGHAERVAGRRWTLVLDDERRIELPAQDVAPALARLDQLDAETGIMTRPWRRIDIRFEDRLIVEPEAGALKRRTAFLKGTPS